MPISQVVSEGRIMATGYTTRGDTFIPGSPRQRSDTRAVTTGTLPNIGLAPDGKRLLVFYSNTNYDSKATVHVTFLVNFFDEMRRKLP